MAEWGYIGGWNRDLVTRQVLIARHLTPYIRQAVDHGPQGRCRCGGTRYLLRQHRWYCVRCGRWVKRLPWENPHDRNLARAPAR